MSSRGAAERPPNRLIGEASPYLRQHAHNPVEWYPWGPEAFETARRKARPIFLSIGYSSCHWCHVMERESFEDEEIARILNDGFVSIKVDREERPDVDDVYMTAVQLTTGHGGWPLTSFLLPDGRPFFGGTYFPPDDRGGRMGFRSLLLQIAEAWRARRDELEQAAARLTAGLEEQSRIAAGGSPRPLDDHLLDLLPAALRRLHDPAHGGFGSAPKFPPHLALAWLLDRAGEGDSEAMRIATKTLDGMALGSIHDHLGGGFHRYSTDERWLLPHFEKMLTDNAQLLGLYARAFKLTGRALYGRTARGIGEYLLREMRGPEGGFFAGTDADSEGKEGKYFVFSEAEIREVLGGEDAAFFCRTYGAKPAGNYRDEATGEATGLNVLHLSAEPSDEEEARLAPLRARLLRRRATRVPPGLDDKRVTGWVALAVSGLSVAGHALGEPRYIAAAWESCRFLLDACRDGTGRLCWSWKDGEAGSLGFLEDEAYLAHALLDLAEADPARTGEAMEFARQTVLGFRRFRRADGPGYTFGGEGNETLVATGRDLFDKAIPSAPGSAVLALVRVADRTRDAALALEARAALAEVSWLMERSPHGMESWFFALSALLRLEERLGAAGSADSTLAASSTRDGKDESPVHVSAELSPPGVVPNQRAVLTVQVRVAPGFYLSGERGLVLEAWGGDDLPVTWVEVPAPAPLPAHDGEVGLEGTLAARAWVTPAAGAARGERTLLLVAKARACGGGVCLPERAVSAVLSLRVGASA